jgi:hypothetical protein
LIWANTRRRWWRTSATLTALKTATDSDSDGYLEYGSDEYKKVTGAPYYSNYKSASGNVTFATGTAYYFKVEPIEWRSSPARGRRPAS